MTEIGQDTLRQILSKMPGENIPCADWQTESLYSGTRGDVKLVTGFAETVDGGQMPYKKDNNQMIYSDILSMLEDEKYLINMVSADCIIRFGHSIGLNNNSRVLDLCCGYGTMLKIWGEVFGVGGVGVDRDALFIETGRSRLSNDRVDLVCGDVLQYATSDKYDVVVCTELSAGLFGSFGEGLAFMERFMKPGGTLAFGRLFSEIPNPPQELIDFDGPVPTLIEIYTEARQCGYLITSMASGDTASWERYIMRDSKMALQNLRQNSGDTKSAAWTDKWHRMYYGFRRPGEGWGLFGVEKI